MRSPAPLHLLYTLPSPQARVWYYGHIRLSRVSTPVTGLVPLAFAQTLARMSERRMTFEKSALVTIAPSRRALDRMAFVKFTSAWGVRWSERRPRVLFPPRTRTRQVGARQVALPQVGVNKLVARHREGGTAWRRRVSQVTTT